MSWVTCTHDAPHDCSAYDGAPCPLFGIRHDVSSKTATIVINTCHPDDSAVFKIERVSDRQYRVWHSTEDCDDDPLWLEAPEWSTYSGTEIRLRVQFSSNTYEVKQNQGNDTFVGVVCRLV